LSGLVNDLSTLSRAERNVLQVDIENINPHKLIEELLEGYREAARLKGLELKTDLDPHLEVLHSSELYCREILQNFITNAIKYTQHGSVTIGAKSDPKGVRFSISDTGIGISRADQEKIFAKFFRSEDYRTRQSNGTGLGLYVTRKLARLLQAEITVKSELNHGSTFSIFIPNLR
jgi:signal transduction histidine kinase